MAWSAATLHITNGDGAVYLLKKAAIAGTHVAWRDALNDGPVPAGLTLEATSAVRSNYLALRGYGNPIRLIRDFERRDAHLRSAGDSGEVILWFEHDLFDQLQLLQTLTSLEDVNLEPGRISVVQSDHYLSSMTVEEILSLYPKRRTATAAIFKSAKRSWDRFTSPEPAQLYAAAGEDAIGLPFLRAALRRLCEEYPSTRDGLSRSERQGLYAVAQGPAGAPELFARAQSREEASFMGDRAFALLLEDLRAADAPLVELEDGQLVTTALGRRILAGDGDWLDEHHIDRWIGGVHLIGEHVTRWNEDRESFA